MAGYTRRNALALPISASQRPVHVLYTKAEQDIPEFSARQTERWRKMAVISSHKINDNAFIMVPHFDVFFITLTVMTVVLGRHICPQCQTAITLKKFTVQLVIQPR